jgi:YD repeat-containing protein
VYADQSIETLAHMVMAQARELGDAATTMGRILRIYAFGEREEITFVSYSYDAIGNMVKTMDALGNTKHFYYDGHLLTQLTNQSGLNFYWEYQGSGDDAKCVHTWGDGGVLEYWTHYEEGITITKDSLGHSTEYHYDADRLIHKIIDANGGVTRQVYNEHGELAVLTNPEGLSVKRIYNDWGKPVQLINENDFELLSISCVDHV